MLLTLVYTLSFAFAMENQKLKEPKLDYSSTLNKSMSKFQRINHIENYLTTVKDGVQALDSKSQMGAKADIKELKKNLSKLELKINEMSEDIKKLKNIIKPTEKTRK